MTMCAGDCNQVGNERERRTVRRGLPPCLTELGIRVVEFAPGVTYSQQQKALITLSNLSLRMRDTDCL